MYRSQTRVPDWSKFSWFDFKHLLNGLKTVLNICVMMCVNAIVLKRKRLNMPLLSLFNESGHLNEHC